MAGQSDHISLGHFSLEGVRLPPKNVFLTTTHKVRIKGYITVDCPKGLHSTFSQSLPARVVKTGTLYTVVKT